MSGLEIVGIVLGAFPLAISAMEHYQDSKKAAGTFWRVKRAHNKDVRNFEYCRTMFTLHVEELLQPLAEIAIDGDEDKCAKLLKEPGGALWKHHEVEDALESRLRNRYKPYKHTMEELLEVMAKLAKESKVEDARFQQLLAGPQTTTSQNQLMQKANTMIKTINFQAKKVHYSLNSTAREALLQEAETYIGRLQDLLSAVDRVSGATSESSTVRVAPIPKLLLHFWQHAARIYRLVRKSMICDCRLMHCAALWLRDQTDAPANVDLHLLFAKVLDTSSQPWTEEGIRIKHAGDSSPCRIPASQAPLVIRTTTAASVSFGSSRCVFFFADRGKSISQLAKNKELTMHRINASKTSRVSFEPQVTALPASLDLSNEGLCRALAKGVQKQPYLGMLIDDDDQIRYDVVIEPKICVHAIGDPTVYELLKPDSTSMPSFQRLYRYQVALKLAATQLKFHSTHWIHRSWHLEHVRFPRDSTHAGVVKYESPYLVTDFDSSTKGKVAASNTADQSFWTLGVVLLELCFAKRLKDHVSFADPAFARNSEDPLLQQAVAQQWAQEVELDAGSDYAHAVKWCLFQSPSPGSRVDWRSDFAQNVLQPLQRCCKSMQSSTDHPP